MSLYYFLLINSYINTLVIVIYAIIITITIDIIDIHFLFAVVIIITFITTTIVIICHILCKYRILPEYRAFYDAALYCSLI